MGFWEWVGDAIFGSFTSKIQHLVVKTSKLGLTAPTDPNCPIKKDTDDTRNYLADGTDSITKDEILGGLQSHSPISPEEAAAIYPAIGAAVKAGMFAVDALNVAIEAGSLGQIDNTIISLKDTLVESMGGKGILSKSINIPIEMAAEGPYRHYWLSVHRPRIPDMGTLQRALSHGLIDDTGFFSLAKYHGFRNEYLEWFRQMSFRPVSPRQLGQMATAGMYDDVFFQDELQDSQYRPESIQKVKEIYKKMALATEISLEKSLRSKQYLDGRITEQEFRVDLHAIGLSDAAIDKTVAIQNLSKENDAKDLSQSVQEKLFIQGVINEATYRSALTELKFTPDGINALVTLANIKKLSDPKPLTLTQMEDALDFAQINEQNYYDRMQKLGYLKDDAALILNTYRLKHTKAPKEPHKDLTLAQIVKMMSQGLLTVEDVYTRMLDMGYSPDDADLLLQSEILALSA